jgi:hypothetical protein
MKLEQSFSEFLKNTVNLDPTRFDVAKNSIDIMKNFLKQNELFSDIFVDIKPQGSFRQGTIIKPVNPENDFDVDLLFEVREMAWWEPKDYLSKLSQAFKDTQRYEDLVDTRGKERCVTIDYNRDFHVDIVPAIKTSGVYKIMNKVSNQFEETDGDGYSEWFNSKNEITGNKYLTKVTRLMKYIRDSKESFNVKSILLTTLLGKQVYESDNKELKYSDLPTSFITILTRLDYFLQINQNIPRIENPILQGEDFTRKLTREEYTNFREKIHKIKNIAIDAYNEKNENESLKKWQEVFGDSFIGNFSKSTALTVCINDLKLENFDHKQNLNDIGILSQNSSSFVEIKAGLYFGTQGSNIINRRYKGSFENKSELPRYRWLKFTASTNYNKPCDFYWQVVNTGKDATEAKKLRGEIFLGKSEYWDSSQYTGVHWVECFVVDKQSKTCVCRSGPFYVGFRERNTDIFVE